MTSRLELLIKQCREVWETMPEVTPRMMDMMIDTFVVHYDTLTNSHTDFDYDKITDESLKIATKNWIEDNKEKI